MRATQARVSSLDALVDRMVIAPTSDARAYSVAWIDTLARGRALGRSVLDHGRARAARASSGRCRARWPAPAVPRVDARAACRCRFPLSLVSRPAVRAFNELWYRTGAAAAAAASVQHDRAVLPPAGRAWPTGTGSTDLGGLVQYQLVVPDTAARRPASTSLGGVVGVGALLVPDRAQAARPGQPRACCRSRSPGWTLAVDVAARPRRRRCCCGAPG